MSNLLTITDLEPDRIRDILDLAQRYTDEPHCHRSLLANETVVCYFAKPSTRTRVSLAAAVANLGAVPQFLSPEELQLGRGETIADTACVISRYAAAFAIRTFDDDDVAEFAASASIPVINALTDRHHPLQALADLLTVRRRHGSLSGATLAYVGDGNNVANSLLLAGAMTGLSIRVATPDGYEPAGDIVDEARRLAESTGATIDVGSDPEAAVDGAQAVYTDVWLSMGDDDETRSARRRALSPYQVNAHLMDLAAPDAVFMHCLPAHRGEEVTSEVIDGPQSVVFDQAESRLWTAQAAIAALAAPGRVGDAP